MVVAEVLGRQMDSAVEGKVVTCLAEEVPWKDNLHKGKEACTAWEGTEGIGPVIGLTKPKGWIVYQKSCDSSAYLPVGSFVVVRSEC